MRQVQGSTAATLDYQVSQKKEKKRVLIRQGVSVPEKLLYLFSVVVCVALASLVLSFYATVAETNLQIQKQEREVERLKESNRLLEMERRDLERGERIRKVAEERGMVPKILHELPQVPKARNGGRG